MSTSTITVAGQSVTLVSFPTAAGPKAVEWSLDDSVGMVRSVFTGQAQAQKWPGADLLSGTVTLAPRSQVEADDWIAFLMQLRGMANAFQLADPLQPKPRGSLSGLPVVDNSGGANLAGSELLATKGWTANAQGVLLRGDWIQLGYRLHRVLDNVDADGSGNATFPIWPTLREQPASSGSAAGWLNATASVGYTQSRSLGNNTAAVRWSNFTLNPSSTIPADAVIQGIYPVLIASATHDQAASYYSYGNSGAAFTDVSEGNFFNHPSNPNATSFASTEFYDLYAGGVVGIGTTLASLANWKMKVLLNTTLNIDVMTDVLNATAAGFAIYYTSASPLTDPQMPPPFSVPTGQGLAWAIPMTVEQSGVLAGCSGIFCPSTGYATGTAATYNGGLQANGAKGLFRLAKNQRGWSADISRLSRISFPFQEYR